MVAQSIGMDIQENRYSKNKISVLCPGHDDRHYGSCFLTERGCHCFVCNRDFDVFDMVRLHCSLDFRNAAGLIADLCGGRERFLVEENNDDPDSDDPGSIKMISRPDMDLIGVFSTPVYTIREAVPSYCEPERKPGFRHEWYPGNPDKGEDDYVVIEEMVMKNPLWELLKSDPATYAELIQNKAWEAWEKYRDIQNIFSKHSRIMARELTSTIRKIEEILIEYGGSLRNPPEFIMKGNINGI